MKSTRKQVRRLAEELDSIQKQHEESPYRNLFTFDTAEQKAEFEASLLERRDQAVDSALQRFRKGLFGR